MISSTYKLSMCIRSYISDYKMGQRQVADLDLEIKIKTPLKNRVIHHPNSSNLLDFVFGNKQIESIVTIYSHAQKLHVLELVYFQISHSSLT